MARRMGESITTKRILKPTEVQDSTYVDPAKRPSTRVKLAPARTP